VAKSIVTSRVINGGPACFGDSGGPLYTVIDGVPVHTGVFSFLLWGTCRGRAEPSYYGRTEDYMEWIEKYIPGDEMCKFGKDGFQQSKFGTGHGGS
jgi:secreted trypsin-like serine protease